MTLTKRFLAKKCVICIDFDLCCVFVIIEGHLSAVIANHKET